MFELLELKQKLLDVCNQSGLPFDAVYFVIKDLWRDAEVTMQNAQANVNTEADSQQKEQTEQQEEE